PGAGRARLGGGGRHPGGGRAHPDSGPDRDVSARRQGAPIAAHGLVPIRREAAFAFLAELDNHWLVADRWIEVVCLDGEREGGRVRIRGPLGLRRTARTQVLTAQPPARLEGRATLGRTEARVRW